MHYYYYYYYSKSAQRLSKSYKTKLVAGITPPALTNTPSGSTHHALRGPARPGECPKRPQLKHWIWGYGEKEPALLHGAVVRMYCGILEALFRIEVASLALLVRIGSPNNPSIRSNISRELRTSHALSTR